MRHGLGSCCNMLVAHSTVHLYKITQVVSNCSAGNQLITPWQVEFHREQVHLHVRVGSAESCLSM